MPEPRQRYHRPELVELGKVGALTLGYIGCVDDSACCAQWPEDPK